MSSIKVNRIGKYEVLDVLGKGGMGVVYKATDPAIGRLVAIKMITSGFADDPAFLRRFYREAQSTGKLQHQNIVIVHELGDQDGTPFLVMEFLEGESLQSIVNMQRPLPLLDKLDLIIQACNGLHYAHQRNIIHRDIKPGNLMVLKDGVLKIVDFGIARIETENVTVPGQVMGSIQYMSPEQINGVSVDCRTDIFSTGVVLYQLLTYTLPFQGKDTGSTLLKIINEPPPPLQNFLDVYPPDLEPVIHRALAKSRDQRYPTAEDFAFDLSQVQEQLKRELVSEYLRVADDLIARSELSRAKEQVFQILRIDRQNRRANDLLRDVQRLIQKQQRSEQARQLRVQAEEAISHQQLDRALTYLEEAAALVPDDSELQQLRDHTRESKERQQKLQEAIRRAESAHWAGDLTDALAAIEEALRVDSNDVEAKALHSAIRGEIDERRRHQQIQELVDEAQRQISSRRFTAAIEALHKAEALDPAAPAIKDLMALAASGQEQERRRKQVEQLTAEIQEALNHDDYQVACEKANAAVQQFPNERGLLKLQTLAERQRQAGEKRRFVEEQLSRARKLLEGRQTEQALAVLEAACKRFPAESALLSLLTVVRENLEQERLEARKNEYIQRAKEALRSKDYAEAISVLETAHVELHVPEIDDLLQFAKDEAAAYAKRQAVDAAAREAHRMLTAEEHEEAIQFLKGVLQETSDEELEILLADAQRQLADFNRRVNNAVEVAERLLGSERVIEAVRYLESQAEACGRSAEFCAILERARHEQERMRAIAGAVQSARAALSKQDFVAAAQAVEHCRESVGDHPDLSRMATEIDSNRRDAAAKTVSKAISDSRMLLLGRSYQSAVELLDSVAAFVELVPAEVRTRYAVLREEAVRGLERMRKRAQSEAAAPPSSSRDKEPTAEQLEWTAASTSSLASAKTRQRDLEELAELAHESETGTNWAALDAVSQRARMIAEHYPGDADVETIASRVAKSAELRATVISAPADEVTSEQPASPITTGPLEVEPQAVPEREASETQEPPPTVLEHPMSPPETGAMPTEVELGATVPLHDDASAVAPEPAPPAGPILVPPRDQISASRPPKPLKPFLIVGAALFVIIVALVIWWVVRGAAPARTLPAIVQTTPEGATVRVKDATCVTPNCKLKLEPGSYTVEASLPGYAPQSSTLQVERGQPSPVINLVLKPLPPHVIISSNFSNGKVWLDAHEVGSLANGQFTLNSVQPGVHTLKVAGRDGEAELTFTAAPARAPAPSSPVRGRNISVLAVSTLGSSAHLDCNCEGTLKLAVDDHPFGELSGAGRDLGDLGQGVHQLQVGTGDEMQTASVKLETAPALNIFLNAERNAGMLFVETGVDNADVFVNNKRYPRTAGGTLRIPLDASRYTVRVGKPGYLPVSPQEIEIRKNKETRVTFNLTPREQKAFFVLHDLVPGARVTIDGKSAGVADKSGHFRSEGLQPGQHVIQLEKQGYESRKIEKSLKSGETQNVSGNDVQMAKASPPPSASAAAPAPPQPAPQPPAPKAATTPATPPHVTDPAKSDWERVRNSSDSGSLASYIAKYPDSPYAAEAKQRIEQLDWDRIRDSSDPKVLQAFVDAHPNSAFSAQARSRLQQVKATATGEADRKAILNTLDRYKTAYERADIGLLTQIWPTLGKQQLKSLQVFFNSAHDVRVQLTNTSGPEIRGDTATVRSTQVVDYTLNNKPAKPIEAKVSFQLRKKDGVWVLDSVR